LAVLCEAVFFNASHLKLSVSRVSPSALATLLLAIPRLVSLDVTDSWFGVHDALGEAADEHAELRRLRDVVTT
jgi:hypothetical protein